MTRSRLAALAAVLASLASPGHAQEAQPESTTALAERASVTAEDFMVATAHPLATKAGYDVLAAGGSAADAAVAVQMMLGLVEPQSSGLGGGTFLLYWNAALGELTSFDGRETAPAIADPGYWLGPDGTAVGFWDGVVGGRSVGVPGTPKLMEEIHARYGRLPWADLLTADNRVLVERFAAIRSRTRGLRSMTALRKLRLYRQTRASTAAFYIAALFNRL